MANDGTTTELAEGEDSHDAKVSSSSEEASGDEEASTASDSPEGDGSDAEECGDKDSAGQTSNNDDSEPSIMIMISELVKSETKK